MNDLHFINQRCLLDLHERWSLLVEQSVPDIQQEDICNDYWHFPPPAQNPVFFSPLLINLAQSFTCTRWKLILVWESHSKVFQMFMFCQKGLLVHLHGPFLLFPDLWSMKQAGCWNSTHLSSPCAWQQLKPCLGTLSCQCKNSIF